MNTRRFGVLKFLGYMLLALGAVLGVAMIPVVELLIVLLVVLVPVVFGYWAYDTIPNVWFGLTMTLSILCVLTGYVSLRWIRGIWSDDGTTLANETGKN